MSYPVISPEPDSYGTVEGVAAYVGVYTDNGVFNSTTNPTYERIVVWIDQVSDMLNVSLSSAGFKTPINQVDAVSALAGLVEQIVSDLSHAANSKGRFFGTRFQEKGGNIMLTILKEINEWVEANSVGFTNLGVPRATGTIGKIGSKDVDASGDNMPPIFQRKAFGNEFKDWTT